MNIRSLHERLTYWSFCILSLAIFTSLSISSLGHIFLVLGLIFYIIDVKPKKYFEELFNQKYFSSFWVLLLLIFIIILSVISNNDIIEHPLRNIFKIKYFLIPLLCIPQMRHLFVNKLTHKNKAFLIKAFLISTSIATLSGIIGLYFGFNPLKMKNACHPYRACGLYGMYMTYGYGISLFLSIVSGLFIYRKNKTISSLIKPPIIGISWIINTIGLYLSYTRGGLLAFLISLPFFFFKKNKKRFFCVIAGITLIAGLSFSVSKKLQTTFLERAGSNSQRITFYKTAWVAFKEKPLLGYGHRNFEPNVKRLKKKYNIEHQSLGGHAHNNFLEYLASTGLLGFLAFSLFVFLWLKESYNSESLVGLISYPFVISFIISGMTQYTFGDGENLFLIMSVWTLGVIFNERR